MSGPRPRADTLRPLRFSARIEIDGVTAVRRSKAASKYADSTPMNLRSQVIQGLRPVLRNRPGVKRALIKAERSLDLVRHTAAGIFPILIQPQTYKLTVAITSSCNLRCVGCRYGRDFMTGHHLSLKMVQDMLDDASRCGVDAVRLYGGEPLLHPDLPRMIEHAVSVGITPYVTTNGVLLKKNISDLYNAGLRTLTIGYYGTADAYDLYVQRPDRFRELEGGISTVRDRYGNEFDIQLNFLLMRPSCSVDAFRAAWGLAERYDIDSVQIDLIHYSLPYFTEGPERCLQFRPQDRTAIDQVVAELLRLKQTNPERLPASEMFLKSIPDWLLKGPGMRVPCDAYRMIWIGADGSVQLCYVTFNLGNLHDKRLSDILYTSRHRDACRAAFALECPNCHCGADRRLQTHLPSRRMYGTRWGTSLESGAYSPQASNARLGL
jgi:MoaA/NifB/PqqE/SkfB family radical SAM enzyme